VARHPCAETGVAPSALVAPPRRRRTAESGGATFSPWCDVRQPARGGGDGDGDGDAIVESDPSSNTTNVPLATKTFVDTL